METLPPIEFICPYDEDCEQHKFPGDWKIGGATGEDPRVDVRWVPDTYEYYDGEVHVIHTTSALLCDEHALDYFTKVASWGPTMNPIWVSVIRHGTRQVIMLPWTYDKVTDMLAPVNA